MVRAMREIKFRCWDLALSKYREDMTMRVDNCRVISSNPEHYVLEQFTGLKDRNGRYIWEGDIVQEAENISIIEWLEEYAAFGYKTETSTVRLYSFYGRVRGNIHEDRELLT